MSELSELLDRHGFRTAKALGQNFLHRQDVIERIADAAGGGEQALEIGAGPGLLSRALCARFRRVVTVEIDRTLAPVCEEVLRGCDNHELIYGDFLKTDAGALSGGVPFTVAGNLPYNITGGIVTKLIRDRAYWENAVIMVQKEAAEKLCAPPGRGQYRAISVITQFFCDAEPLFDVPPDCFIPAPHVTSRVLRLTVKKNAPSGGEADGFFAFVNRVFSQRRKLLTSVIQKEKTVNALKKLGKPEKTRGEELSPDELFFVYCEQI